jgi:DNA-binding phage protein
VGFQELAELTESSPKSLMRMLSPKGNPTAQNLFGIIAHLQTKEGVQLTVRPRPSH